MDKIWLVCLLFALACQEKKTPLREVVRSEVPKKLLSKQLSEKYESLTRLAQAYRKAGKLDEAREYNEKAAKVLTKMDSLLHSPNPMATIP